MDVRNSLPSAIYRSASTSADGDLKMLPREVRVGIAIEMSIDRIFMAMYCRRSVHSSKSINHIRRAVTAIQPRINEALFGFELNSLEGNVLDHLHSISYVISNSDIVVREIGSVDMIVSLLERVVLNNSPIPDIIRSTKLVLAMANQIDYSDSSIVVPYIRIVPCEAPYAKCLTTHEIRFDLNRDMNGRISDIWYRLYGGLRFSLYNGSPFSSIANLCATINIGTVPDVSTGLGITKFTYESYIASDITKRFIETTQHGTLCDDGIIRGMMIQNNPWMSKNFSLINNSSSLEAAADPAAQDNANLDNADTKTETTNPLADTAPDNSTDPTLDAGSDTSTTDNADASATDKSSTNLDTPSDDGSDNTDERRPILFGLNLSPAKNESLDDLMYKLSVAKFIDTVIEFNHDELPLETVTLLTQWKSNLLFLTDAKETARLLKELKIKLK